MQTIPFSAAASNKYNGINNGVLDVALAILPTRYGLSTIMRYLNPLTYFLDSVMYLSTGFMSTIKSSRRFVERFIMIHIPHVLVRSGTC